MFGQSAVRRVETPLNGRGVASPPPETLRGWRDGPRHPPEIASGGGVSCSLGGVLKQILPEFILKE